ncbi:unnamed protein product [Schistocephalus solidus]|uniref:CPSF_A domain-containing protein n=1 Tax=Schistocephalus solidus TaxID=70667 RepID=A0A183SG78_SCHSO|nr:unnamed protein product [Schistocephalus solidus]
MCPKPAVSHGVAAQRIAMLLSPCLTHIRWRTRCLHADWLNRSESLFVWADTATVAADDVGRVETVLSVFRPHGHRQINNTGHDHTQYNFTDVGFARYVGTLGDISIEESFGWLLRRQDAEETFSFKQICVRDPVFPSQLQYSEEELEVEVSRLPSLLLVHRQGLRSIQQRRQYDSSVHLKLGDEVETASISDDALHVSEGLTGFSNQIVDFIVDFGAA